MGWCLGHEVVRVGLRIWGVERSMWMFLRPVTAHMSVPKCQSHVLLRHGRVGMCSSTVWHGRGWCGGGLGQVQVLWTGRTVTCIT